MKSVWPLKTRPGTRRSWLPAGASPSITTLVYDVGPYSQVFGEAAPVVGHYESHPSSRTWATSATVFPLSTQSRGQGRTQGMEKLFESSDTSYQKIGLTPPIKLDPDKDKKGLFTHGRGRHGWRWQGSHGDHRQFELGFELRHELSNGE